MTKQEAGKLGGAATVAKHGRGYMARLGALGAAMTWKKYRLDPAGPNGWAMVDKQTGIVKATIGRANW